MSQASESVSVAQPPAPTTGERAAAASEAAQAAAPESGDPPFRLRWQPLEAADLPAQPARVGQVLRALRWQDDGGELAAAFVRSMDVDKGEAQLQVLVWELSSATGKVKLRHEVKDGVSECEADLHAEFVEDAFWLTDLDQDGESELTLAYRQSCTSDVSPLDLKVLLFEGQDSYALEGKSRVDVGGGEQVGGQSTPDAALQKVPVFQLHTQRVWDAIVALSPWTRPERPERTAAVSATPLR